MKVTFRSYSPSLNIVSLKETNQSIPNKQTRYALRNLKKCFQINIFHRRVNDESFKLPLIRRQRERNNSMPPRITETDSPLLVPKRTAIECFVPRAQNER